MSKKIIGATVGTPMNPNMFGGGGGGGTSFKTDETLSLEKGVLRVNTANLPEEGNTMPITSGAVYDEFSKAIAILKTI